MRAGLVGDQIMQTRLGVRRSRVVPSDDRLPTLVIVEHPKRRNSRGLIGRYRIQQRCIMAKNALDRRLFEEIRIVFNEAADIPVLVLPKRQCEIKF